MDSQLLRARIEDTYNLCIRSNTPHFLGFLTENEAAVANNVLTCYGAKFRFWGGYEQGVTILIILLVLLL